MATLNNPNVVKSHGVGLHLSCFSVDFDVMRRLLQTHGVPFTDDMSLIELQYHILRHLISGECVRTSGVKCVASLGFSCRPCLHHAHFPFPECY